MHGPAVGVGNGLGVTPPAALAYLLVAGFMYALARDLVSVLAAAPRPAPGATAHAASPGE